MNPVSARSVWKMSARRFAGHLRVLSIRRAPGKLKYLAGTESGMGVWSNDIIPEEAAQRLRDAGQGGTGGRAVPL